jgi:hypothetical protein
MQSFFNLASSNGLGNMLSVLMLRGRFEEISCLGPKNENYRFEDWLQWLQRESLSSQKRWLFS